MKKTLSVFCLFLCLPLLFACGGEETPAVSGDAFTPLLRFAAAKGATGDTRLFYFSESDGFLYLQDAGDGAFTGGFVSPARSLSSEGVLHGEGDLSRMIAWEGEKDRAFVLGEDSLTFALLRENSATAAPLTDTARDPFVFDQSSFVTKKGDLLLLCPVSLEESYVLANTALLPDFARLLCVSGEGRRLWYATADGNGNFDGIAFFEYGENLPLGREDFSFEAVQRVGESALLFACPVGDGSVTYLYRDLDSGKTRSVLADSAFDGVICDAGGKVLCGATTREDGGEISVFDLETGKMKGSYSLSFGAPSPSLAVDKKGETLLVSVKKDGDEVLGTLDLTKF